jgi:hypothetical protein
MSDRKQKETLKQALTRIIEGETRWFMGWYTDEKNVTESAEKAAKKVLDRIGRALCQTPFDCKCGRRTRAKGVGRHLLAEARKP